MCLDRNRAIFYYRQVEVVLSGSPGVVLFGDEQQKVSSARDNARYTV